MKIELQRLIHLLEIVEAEQSVVVLLISSEELREIGGPLTAEGIKDNGLVVVPEEYSSDVLDYYKEIAIDAGLLYGRKRETIASFTDGVSLTLPGQDLLLNLRTVGKSRWEKFTQGAQNASVEVARQWLQSAALDLLQR